MVRTAVGGDEGATIGFLHTAGSHVDRFAALLADLDPTATGVHLVREDLLRRARAAESRANGPMPEAAPERDAVAAALAETVADLGRGCRAVLVTCSTLGPYVEALPAPVIADRSVPLVRIDRPMAREAVRLASARAAEGQASGWPRWPSPTPYVVVVAALRSAVQPARTLLAACAAEAGIEVSVGVLEPRAAWDAFERGDTAEYLRLVEAEIARAARNQLADLVVLAQASMAELADPQGTQHGVPVLASPDLAVAEALRRARP